MLSSQNEVFLDRAESAGAVKTHDIPAGNTSNDAGEETSGTDGVAFESEVGEGHSAGGLDRVVGTMKPIKPKMAAPVTLRCSKDLLSELILVRSVSSR